MLSGLLFRVISCIEYKIGDDRIFFLKRIFQNDSIYSNFLEVGHQDNWYKYSVFIDEEKEGMILSFFFRKID